MKSNEILNNDDHEIFNNFLDSSNGNVVFFVGAGVSHNPPSNMPLWNDVYDKLLNKAKKLFPDCKEQFKLIEELKSLDDVHSLLNGFEKLKNILGDNIYSTTIRTEFRTDGKQYPKILDTIITRNIKGIITTNIDCLIETAHNTLLSKGEINDNLRIISPLDLVVASEILHYNNWLWKIHGTLDNPDTWIFTLSEYYSSQQETKFIESLINVFHNTRIVFIGYSAKDIDLLYMLEKLNSRFGTSMNGHILLTRTSEKFDLALYAKYGIDILAYGGDSDHSNLLHLLECFPKKKIQRHP